MATPAPARARLREPPEPTGSSPQKGRQLSPPIRPRPSVTLMTERTLEPRHVGPVAGGHLRASDTDRDHVATVLNTAFAEGRLSREEHDERLDELLRAKTFDDLVGLTRDLVVVATPAADPAPRPGPVIDTTAVNEDIDRMVAVFSGAERKGRWRVRRQMEVLAVFGGVDLDLREAVFESPVVEIGGFWCFGGLDVKVPAGVEVRNEVMAVFGGAEVKDVPDPAARGAGAGPQGPRPVRGRDGQGPEAVPEGRRVGPPPPSARLRGPPVLSRPRDTGPTYPVRDMEDLFAPPGYAWQRLSPAYRSLRRLTTVLVAPILLSIPALVLGLAFGLWWVSLVLWAFAALVVTIRWSLIERTWRSWGYVEREDDLYITHGVLFRTLVAVPYGRMQLVEVGSGPLERAFGLATVSLKTASPETNATIPGLPPEEAARLRDRLTELGEAHASGL